MPQKLTAAMAHLAVVDHFDTNYGRNESKLDSWQSLCRDLGVEVGTSITQCKKMLKGTYVNIVDFVQAKKENKAVRTFASAGALARYMKTGGKVKFFPLKKAKDNPILKWMLIEVR